MALKGNSTQDKNQGSFKKDVEPTRYGQSSSKDIDTDQDDVGNVGQGRSADMDDEDLDDDDDIRK